MVHRSQLPSELVSEVFTNDYSNTSNSKNYPVPIFYRLLD